MRALAMAAMLVLAAGCEREAHNMYETARTKPMQPSTLFGDGLSVRPRLEGTVEQSSGTIASTSSGRREEVRIAQREAAERSQANPYPATKSVLERGRERFAIYCEPCHGLLGEGDGPVARRGFPHPPSYHIDRLKQAPDRHFYDVMTQGYGVMYPYADRVQPQDRWAIVAWIRELQREGR